MALARDHGVYSVAQALRLDDMGLRKRVGGEVASQRPADSQSVFVELGLPVGKPEECLIEFESTRGNKMRIKWPARIRIGRRYCAPGAVRNSDSDHGADARAGGHRAGRWTKRH